MQAKGNPPMIENPERQLWWTVLERAVLDALWTATITHDSSGTSLHDQRTARAWFGRKDFHTVCHLAGADPDFIRDKVVPMFDRPADERMAWLRSMSFSRGRRQRDFHRERSA
jgi:hypothetical protein